MSFLNRKTRLLYQFNFTCQCSLCSKQRDEKADHMITRECSVCKVSVCPKIDLLNDELFCPICTSIFVKLQEDNENTSDTIVSTGSELSTEPKAVKDVDIVNHLIEKTEILILEKRWEYALVTGLRAVDGILDWAQYYPSTGLFTAKMGKLYLEQECSSLLVQKYNVSRALHMFETSLKCLSVSLPSNHKIIMEVECLYKSTNDTMKNNNWQ